MLSAKKRPPFFGGKGVFSVVVQQSESKLFRKIPPVHDHAVVKFPDSVASCGFEKFRKKGMNHASQTGFEHAKRKGYCVTKMLEVGFFNILKVRLGLDLAHNSCFCCTHACFFLRISNPETILPKIFEIGVFIFIKFWYKKRIIFY